MADQKQVAIAHLAKMSRSLREAIAASLPCAAEQYITVSIPGLVIDTSANSPYIPKEPITSGRRNKVVVNEARLVDNMIPLDHVMLGPTGKSVTRSYTTALDFLKPRDTTIGVFGSHAGDEGTEYGQALQYLKKPAESASSTGKVNGTTIPNTDFEGTTVGRYVRKQLLWAEAQGNWDAVRDEAEEEGELAAETQTAAVMRDRKMMNRRRKAELQARWMDWVVNGDKLNVDHNFAIVDRSDLMARVERAKAATRDMMVLDPKDGTDWARVYLQPEAWARYCRTKAESWSNRNAVNVELLQVRIARLEQEEIACKALSSSASGNLKGQATLELRTSKYSEAEYQAKKKAAEDAKTLAEKARANPESLGDVEAIKTAKAALQNKAQGADDGPLKQALSKAVADEQNRLDDVYKKAEADAKAMLDNHPDKLLTDKLRQVNEWDQALRSAQNLTEEQQKTEALESANHTDAEVALAALPTKTGRVQRAKTGLDTAMKDLLEIKRERDDFKTKEALYNMRQKNSSATKATVDAQLASIQDKLATLRAQLEDGRQKSKNPSRTIVDVTTDAKGQLAPVRSDPAVLAAAAQDTSTADQASVWTKIAFSVAAKEGTTDSKASSFDAGFQAKYSGWFVSASASNQTNKSSEELHKTMANCDLSVSFDALLVQIQRPWLHAELFSDYDVDASKSLSPGAQTVIGCIGDLSNPDNINKLKPFGTFPAYPTAFVVAADATLELSSSESKVDEIASHLSTDSSFSMSFGPFGVDGSAHLKTDDRNANQRVEAKDGVLRISFQAPQIIAWVSEVLPELPRTAQVGGLMGVPSQAFRF